MPKPRPARSRCRRRCATSPRRHGALTIVDCVTSLGGTPVLLDAWQADATYSGSQKCLSCTPGLSPVSYSERAIEKVKAARKGQGAELVHGPQPGACLLGRNARTYHHTAPGNSLYGLHEALLLLEGRRAGKRLARHRRNYEALKAGVEAMGLKYVVKPEARLPQLNSVYIPEGIDDLTVRKTLLADYNIEIGAGLGPLAGKIWRFGLMGYSSQPTNVLLLPRHSRRCSARWATSTMPARRRRRRIMRLLLEGSKWPNTRCFECEIWPPVL